jgi:putative ABC transport system substrate-binding protein
VTGFTLYDHAISTKWLELLKEAVPGLASVVLMHSPAGYAMDFYIAPVQAAAPRFNVRVSTAVVKSEDDIDRAIAALAGEPGAGLIVLPDTYTTVHRLGVIAAAARYRVPATYPTVEYWAKDGGLISYGSNLADMYVGAAIYIDRILRGERAGDLPIQQPTKYILAVNLKTAKAMGITIPESLLVRADEVIE